MNSPFENQPLQQDSPFKAYGRFGRLSYAAWTFLFTLVLVTAILLIMFILVLQTLKVLQTFLRLA